LQEEDFTYSLGAGEAMKNKSAILIALSLVAAPLPVRAGDALQLEPSFEQKKSHTSACIASKEPALCVRLTEKALRILHLGRKSTSAT
jgi:hypothetical protein